MDSEFTQKLKNWLDTDSSARDIAAGAMLLLQLTRNRVQYRYLMHNLATSASFIELELRKRYELRVSGVTHDEVMRLQTRALAVDTAEPAPVNPDGRRMDAFTPTRGRRPDHDRLPAEIQALFDEAGAIRQKMRDAQTHLRLLSQDTATCSDADRMVFIRQLSALDKELLSNYDRYDHYIIESE